MADVEDSEGKTGLLVAPYRVGVEVHDIDAPPSQVSSGGKRIEVIVVNRDGRQNTKQISWEAFTQAGEPIFDEFVEGCRARAGKNLTVRGRPSDSDLLLDGMIP
jgi:hypothetical protein